MELELLTRAAAVAALAHTGQLRKEGNEPYINHPLRVAHAAALAGLPVEAICAALLHDVVEDTAMDQAAIDAQFSPRISHLVKLLTKWWPDDAPARDKDAGKPTYYGAIQAEPQAVSLKLLDRADNLESMVRMLPRGYDWARRYYAKTQNEIEPLAAGCENAYAREAFTTSMKNLEAALVQHKR